MRCNLHDADIMEDGIAIGEARGEERAKLAAARNMLIENDYVEKVARCLVLPIETVQKIADELKVSVTQ